MRSLLVVASIAVGVFSIGMIAGTYVIISHDMGASYASANPANIDLITDGFDQDFVTTIERLDGVQDVEGRRIFSVRARVAGGEWARLDLVAFEDFQQVQINQMHLLSGSPLLEERELVLERSASGRPAGGGGRGPGNSAAQWHDQIAARRRGGAGPGDRRR